MKTHALFSRRSNPFWPTLLALTSIGAQAEYHNFNTQSGADGIIQEVRWPYWAETTYNAIYSQTLSGSDGGSCYFYGGMPSDPNGNPPSSIIWSFWPPTGTSVPGAAVTAHWSASNMYAPPHVGEGASGKVSGDWPLITTNRWYREVLRVWQPADGTPHLAYTGRWLRDPATSNWYHIATMQIPFSATGVNGLSGFQEDFGHGNRYPRRTDYRNVYSLKNGVWTAAKQFTPSVRQLSESGTCGLLENATAAFFETCSGSTYLYSATNNPPPTTGNLVMLVATNQPTASLLTNKPPGITTIAAVNNYAAIALTLANQSATPDFDPIVVTNATASKYADQVIVSWQLPSTSSPQLAYVLEIHDNPAYLGSPVLTVFQRDPEARQQLLNIGAVATPYVSLKIVDIFDRTNAAVLLAPAAVALNVATNPPVTTSGLGYKYYESATSYYWQYNGVNWSTMPNFNALTPVYQGAVSYPDLTPRRRRNGYAFNYTGFLTVPAEGLYAFTLKSCAGSKLYLDGALIINHDGNHSPSEQSGWAALAAGRHAVNLQYFFDTQNSDAGDLTDQINLSFAGPGFAQTEVPPGSWSRVPAAGEPELTLQSPADGAVVAGSNVTLTANSVANGATLNKVQFYVGESFWGQLTAAPFSLDSFFWSAADNPIRARLFYNTSFTLDSPVSFVTTTNAPLEPWLLAGASEHVQPFGAKITAGTYSLIGDGLNLLSRPVDGNCTIIARVAGITSTGAAPDGTTPGSAWHAGILMRESTNATPGTPLGDSGASQYSAVFATVNSDTHYQDYTMANAGGPYWSSGLGGQRWLKLQRSGATFISSVSTDGANWTPVWTNTLSGIATRLYVGLFTYAAPSQNPNVHWAAFDNVSITGGIVGPPGVTISPLNETAYTGQSTTFTALPSGNPPFSYQWQVLANGQFVAAEGGTATNASFTLTNLQPTNSGFIRVVLTNASGSVTSSPATLDVLSPPAYFSQVLPLGPLAYWRLNDAGPIATDAIGARDGTGQGGVQFGALGVGLPFPGFEPDNRCAQFNGTDSSVAIPALNLSTANFTFSGWVRRNGTQVSWSGIVFCRSGSTTAGVHFGTAQELRYTWNDGANTYNWNSGLTIPNNQWTFFALAIEPTRAIMYRGTNNILRSATNNVAHAAQTFPGTTYFGYDPNSSTRRLNGWLDEVALFNRTLTPTEVAALLQSAQTTLPAVQLTAPVNGATFAPDSDIPLAATVTTNGHSISKVQFFNGPELLGEDDTAPFGLTWSNAPAGQYTLLAQVVYDTDQVMSSPPINITVNPPVSASVTPPTQELFAGYPFMLQAAAAGTPPFTWQWQHDGTNLPGADSATFSRASAVVTDSGNYQVVVADFFGAVTSAVASVTVKPLTPGSYMEAVVTNNPVAYWRLGELSGPTAVDMVGDNEGTYFNAFLAQTGALATDNNPCVRFNGTSSYVGTGESLASGRTAFTLEGWFKINVVPARMGFFGQNDCLEFGLSNGTTLQCWTAGGGSVSVNYTWGTGGWHHVAVVGNGTDLRLYVDGSLVATGGSPTGNYGASSDPFNIGGGGIWDASGNWFGGWLDEVAYYDQALPATEIQRHYLLALRRPIVVLTSPTNGALHATGATIPLTATVTSNSHSIHRVQFFSSTTFLGEDSNPPYAFNWMAATPGMHSITAKVIYDAGELFSAAHTVTIWDNTPPTLLATLNGGNVDLTLTGVPGQHYRLDTKLSLTNDWQVFTDLVSLAVSPLVLPLPATNAQQFFRAVGLP